MQDRKIPSKSTHTISTVVIHTTKLIVCLSIVLFHNFYIFSYDPDNISLNTLSGEKILQIMLKLIFGFKHALNTLGYIYADLMIMIFGRASYLFGAVPIIILIRKKRIVKSNLYLQILYLAIFSISFSLLCHTLPIILKKFHYQIHPIWHHSVFEIMAVKIHTLLNAKYITLLSLLTLCIASFAWLANVTIKTLLIIITSPIYLSLKSLHHIVAYACSVSVKSNNQNKESNTKECNTNNSFILPSTHLLSSACNIKAKPKSHKELELYKEKLLHILKDFGISGKITNIHQGPVITTYEFEPSAGIKASRIIGLADDIARSLCASSTRIAHISGKNVLGIEIPNEKREFFGIRNLLETKEYQHNECHLPIILGKSLNGSSKIVDLAKMPHLLIAGTTGSGKSVSINTLILSLLFHCTPNECQFIMIDPKMLELSSYSNIPNLLMPVITEPKKAVAALKWVVQEMEQRYSMMSDVGVKNIHSFNEKILNINNQDNHFEKKVQVGFDDNTKLPIYDTQKHTYKTLPFIVVLVDEMADLMLVAGKEIEVSIQRLAQMARASGIHLIMATQRPSVDVITGVIKANFPSRISFKVASKIDSRTILGESGAEQLLGMGDMLYIGNAMEIDRIHGPFVTEEEIEKVVNYLKSQPHIPYKTKVNTIVEQLAINKENSSKEYNFQTIENCLDHTHKDDLYAQALKIVLEEKKASISYIQRKLRIGYNKAASIIEQMEAQGIVSCQDATGKRTIIGIK